MNNAHIIGDLNVQILDYEVKSTTNPSLQISSSHVYREQNQQVVRLSNIGLTKDFGTLYI